MTSGVFASLNSSFSHLLFCKSESGFARVAIGNRSVKPPREDRTGLGRQNIIVGGKAPSASPIAVFAECENWTRRGRPMRGRMSRSFRFLWRQVKLLTAAVQRWMVTMAASAALQRPRGKRQSYVLASFLVRVTRCKVYSFRSSASHAARVPTPTPLSSSSSSSSSHSSCSRREDGGEARASSLINRVECGEKSVGKNGADCLVEWPEDSLKVERSGIL